MTFSIYLRQVGVLMLGERTALPKRVGQTHDEVLAGRCKRQGPLKNTADSKPRRGANERKKQAIEKELACDKGESVM
jgi:hypothetical protein